MRVLTGLDQLRAGQHSSLAGAAVGVVANQASVDSELLDIVSILRTHSRAEVKILFAPEHGFWGARQDMAHVDDVTDTVTGLPVQSLYGTSESTLSPSIESLKGLDFLVVDLPDIGTRYYTFAQTLLYCMRVAKTAGLKILVLDRPNPIGGTQIEGPPLTACCRSFCGYAPVPVRHGLTLGELALLMNEGFGVGEDSIPRLDCKLEVLWAKNWNRNQYADETKLPWVLPSPNMPTLDTAIVYPGACLIEGTELSEGRGTTKPFEFVGAPGIDAINWAEATMAQGLILEGAKLRPIAFEPGFQKHRSQICSGLQIHITNRQTFQPIRWFVAMLSGLAATAPKALVWREKAYEFVDKVPAIDLLWGSNSLRETIDNRRPLRPLIEQMETEEQIFKTTRLPFLHY